MFNRFQWTEKIKDSVLRKNVQELLEYAGIVASFNRKKVEENPSDYEGARQDLRSAMEEIYESAQTQPPAEGKNGHNPLWDAMMTIRPAMISARIPKRFIYIVSQELWAVVQTSRKNQQTQKAEFFESLLKQMAERSVVCWRTLISGGVVVERKKEGENVVNILHGFPVRIPREVAQEVGLKLTTKFDNIQVHKAAVAEMRKRGLVPEKVGEALQILAEDLYAYLGRT